MNIEMEKVYQAQQNDTKWAKIWEESGAFSPSGHGTPYSIMIPPPNVTGSLHMGHAFQDTLMDILIRYHRMLGDNTLWQMGTDHAGIATQMVVERQLLAENKSRLTLGREAFVQKVWEWKEQSGGNISQQLKRLGASLDWPNERFTMDEGLSEAVQSVFIQLHEEELIYRGKRLVNWDPKLGTAVSDLEVLTTPEKGSLWTLRYPLLEDPSQFILVATTRPETLLGDMALAVHPEDPRYQALIGKEVLLPLCDRSIPIIADSFVDPEFGTGCVKITPAHDFNDFEVGQRHGLAMMNIFTKTAHLNTEVPLAYQGLDRFVARTKIIADLKDAGLLEKIEPHDLQLRRGDRSGEILEPYLSAQWFLKTKTLAKKAAQVVENGEIRFVPEHWNKTYFEWLREIQDWCISRQLWWGHRIPAWYDQSGKIYVGASEIAIREKYKLGPELTLKQDEDVLDTWFSSALWPFSSLGWPEQTERLAQFYPGSVLVTGFDIIFFWVARMIMFGLKFTKQIPFKTVYVHGLILDPEGQKMSKSKGNVLDPIDLIDGISLDALIEKRCQGLMQPKMAENIAKNTKKQFPEGIASYGTDPLRFTLCALANNGRFIRFDLGRLEGYRNFCNKLWNATRFVLLQVESYEGTPVSFNNLTTCERWIFSELQNTITETHQHLENYRFDLLAQNLYDFTWNIYCDWYLEFAKLALQDPNKSSAQKQGIQFTLTTILSELLKLLHPIIPFITEELWQHLAPKNNSSGLLIKQTFPKADLACIDHLAQSKITWIQGFVLSIRNLRGELKLPPKQSINILIQKLKSEEITLLEELSNFWQPLTKVSKYTLLDAETSLPACVSTLYGEVLLALSLEGTIDPALENERLNKEISRYTKEYDKISTQLGRPEFLSRAPAKLVTETQQRLAECSAALEELKEQLIKIGNMNV